MAFDIDTLIQGVRASRKTFLKHLKGVGNDQWDWKPYSECKSIRETIAHLVSDDRAFMEILDKGSIADYEVLQEDERDVTKLLALLDESHENLCTFLGKKFADTPLDTMVNFFMGAEPLGTAVAGIAHEDSYHAGQVAFIRMATKPEWNYYEQVYGGE